MLLYRSFVVHFRQETHDHIKSLLNARPIFNAHVPLNAVDFLSKPLQV